MKNAQNLGYVMNSLVAWIAGNTVFISWITFMYGINASRTPRTSMTRPVRCIEQKSKNADCVSVLTTCTLERNLDVDKEATHHLLVDEAVLIKFESD